MNTTVLSLAGPATKSSVNPVHTQLLQRKCACGGPVGVTSECEGCDKKKLSLQRSTEVAGPATSNSNAQTQSSSGMPPVIHEVLRSPGQPLEAETRAFFEPRFGHDFSLVRVHSNTRAAESAAAVGARAYTVGRDIVFGNQNYDPNSIAGRKLLAHELTHVLQQAPSKNSLQRAENKTHDEPVSVTKVGGPRLSRQGGGSAPSDAAARCRGMGVPCPVGTFNYNGSICRLIDCQRATSSILPGAISPGTCVFECRDGQTCVCVLFGTRNSAVCTFKFCSGSGGPSSQMDYEPLIQQAVAAAEQQHAAQGGEGQAGAGGAQSEGEPTMQAKLEISQPGDVFEQEADQVAERVLRD